MNENKVSEERIRELIESSEKNVTTIFGKVTVVSLKLPNGFVITESSGCVDPENYDEKTGESICMGKIEDRLWELEGYLLQNRFQSNANRTEDPLGCNYKKAVQHFSYAIFDNSLTEDISMFKVKHNFEPQMIIVNPNTFSFLKNSPFFCTLYMSEAIDTYRGIDIYASRRIENVNDFELF